MQSLDASCVQVWLVFPGEIGEDALARYRALCTAAERAKVDRFHFARHRLSHLVTGAAARVALSKYASVAPQDWRFEPSAHGRPQISREHAGLPATSFNISHTDGLVAIAIAVSGYGDIGVDVENVDARVAPIDIARAYFAPAELAALQQEPMPRRALAFFRYWTLKESYIKARGLGLQLPLDQFSFQLLPDLSLKFSNAPALNDPASQWRFWQFCVTSSHLLALCLRCTGAERPLVQLKKLVPLVSEDEFEFDWMAVCR